jgi:leucyl aminopeptidase
MEWKLTNEPLSLLAIDAIIVFHGKNREYTEGTTREIDESLEFRISSLIREHEISGNFGEISIMHNWGKIPSNRVIVAGVGEETNLDLRNLKDAVGNATRKAQKMGLKNLGISPPSFTIQRFNMVDVVQALVEGVELGSYRHQHYRSEDTKKGIEQVWLSLNDFSRSASEAGIERGKIFASSTNLARYLVHEPPNFLSPEKLASYAEEVADRRGLEIEILGQEELEKLGMHAFLSVAKGSRRPPRMAVLSYKGAPESKEVLGLVGKGITFDSKGLQIKPGSKMVDMKGDMGGAAAVIGAMDGIGALKPHCNVIGVIPTCENMCDGNAYRPGDVLHTFSGKTIEVAHTDAEGRVILADALAYARRKGATKLVDIATLTGAIVIALGHETTGLMTNYEDWGNEVKQAARIAGERVWELPIYDEYKEYIRSDIADLKNSGGPSSGSITAALFLTEFADGLPWVHLDIAGTSESNKEKGIHQKGATGIMARTLIQLAASFEQKS